MLKELKESVSHRGSPALSASLLLLVIQPQDQGLSHGYAYCSHLGLCQNSRRQTVDNMLVFTLSPSKLEMFQTTGLCMSLPFVVSRLQSIASPHFINLMNYGASSSCLELVIQSSVPVVKYYSSFCISLAMQGQEDLGVAPSFAPSCWSADPYFSDVLSGMMLQEDTCLSSASQPPGLCLCLYPDIFCQHRPTSGHIHPANRMIIPCS